MAVRRSCGAPDEARAPARNGERNDANGVPVGGVWHACCLDAEGIELHAQPTTEPAPPRRVLLLGAAGLIGSAVLARFRAEGIAVRAGARGARRRGTRPLAARHDHRALPRVATLPIRAALARAALAHGVRIRARRPRARARLAAAARQRRAPRARARRRRRPRRVAARDGHSTDGARRRARARARVRAGAVVRAALFPEAHRARRSRCSTSWPARSCCRGCGRERVRGQALSRRAFE
jgi:hypothetical protein